MLLWIEIRDIAFGVKCSGHPNNYYQTVTTLLFASISQFCLYVRDNSAPNDLFKRDKLPKASLRLLLAFALLFLRLAFFGIRQHLSTLGPRLPFSGEFFDFLGLGGGEVVMLGAVGFEVIEFPRTVSAGADEFQIAVAHGGVAFMLPEERAGDGETFRWGDKEGFQRHAFQGRDGVAVSLFRIAGTTDIGAGRHDVDQVRGCVAEFVFGSDTCWPVCDERRGDAAFVVVVLVLAEGRVLQKGPAFAAEPVGGGLSRITLGAAVWAGLGVAAVVAHEEDERVFQDAALFEAVHEIADGLIHAMHGGGIDGHEVVKAVLLLRCVVFPQLDGGRAWRFFPRGIHDAEFLLAGDAGIAQGSPAVFVFAAKFGDGIRWCLEREMRRVVAEVQVKRLLLGERLINELQAIGGPQISRIPILRQTRIVVGDGFAIEKELRLRLVTISEVKAACRCIQRAIKAALPRHHAEVLTHMPLSGHRGEVAGGPQHLRDGHARVIEPALIARHALVLRHVPDAGLMRIQSGEQRGPSGAATAGVVELRKAQAVLRQSVEMRCGDLRTIAADVGKAHVINEDDDDVGLFGGLEETTENTEEHREEAFHGALVNACR